MRKPTQAKERPTGADRVAKSGQTRLRIEFVPCQMNESRRRAAGDFSFFCEHYLAHRFPLPDSPDQVECKTKIQHAVLTGGTFAQSAPRGDGKTQRAIAGALWAALCGHWRYTAVIGATGELAKNLVRDAAQELADNEKLKKDWPEICRAVRMAYERPNTSHYITAVRKGSGKPAFGVRLECTANKLVLPSIPGWVKDSPKIGGSVIHGAGITAAFRGLRHTTAAGETIRPDGALLDDIQTRKSAMSLQQTERVLQVLRGDIQRLAGPTKELAAVCNCTVIRRGDAADQLLDNKANPQWRGVRKKMVYEWPTRRDLWDDYIRRRKAGLLAGDGGGAANKFYAAHRADMDAGGKVGWAARFRSDSGETSALQCAFNILADTGEEAFQAECQNEPLEKVVQINAITPAVVVARLSGLDAGKVEPLARFTTAFVDVNRRCLAWAAVAWQANMTGQVIGYGVWPTSGARVWDEKKTGGEAEDAAVFRNLCELGEELYRPLAFAKPLDRILVDVGWGTMDKAVFQFLAHAHQVKHWNAFGASRGRAANKFRFPVEASRMEWAFLETWEGKGSVLVHDADWHRLKVQEAFAIQHGAPASLSVFGSKEIQHLEFAKQICAERLTQFFPSQVPVQSGVYQWERVPAQWNEWLDCVVGCRVGACFELVSRGMVLSSGMPAPTIAPPPPPDPNAHMLPKPEPAATGPVSYESGWE